MESGIPGLPMPKQVGYAVYDCEATMRSYTARYGLQGAIKTFELNAASGYRYRGRPAQCLLKIGVITLGDTDLEFIEVLSGEHPARDHLAAVGEGINHLGFFVDNLEAALHALPDASKQVVIDGTFGREGDVRGRFVYLANPAGGPMYEIMALET